MAAHAKDQFCGPYLEFFQTYHKLAAQHWHSLNRWHKDAQGLLDAAVECSLEALQAFLDTADGNHACHLH